MKAARAEFSASVFCQDVRTFVGETTAARRAFVVVCSYKYVYHVAAGVLSIDGTFRLSKPFDLSEMRSEIAAALGDRARKQIEISFSGC